MFVFNRRCLSPQSDPPAGDPPPVKIDNPDPNPPPPYTPPDIDMTKALPPEYREKPAFKGKGFVDLVKEHDNLQTLLGQRPAGIPKEDASDEEWGKFLGALKPKTADEYVLPDTDFSKATPRSPEYLKAMREIFYGADVNKRQAAKLTAGIEGVLAKAKEFQEKAKIEAAEKQAAEFEGMLDKTFGAQKQEVLDRTKKMMVEMVDPAMKETVGNALKDLPNSAMFALASILDGVHKKYIASDAPPGGDGSNVGGDPATWQAEAEKIMASETYRDWRKSGHDDAKKRVQELFGMVAASQQKK